MAYFLYKRTKHRDGQHRFVLRGGISLYGCHAGIVARTLRRRLEEGERFGDVWHIQMKDALRLQKSDGNVFIIDLKPKQRRENKTYSFYELTDLWGYSYEGWTPVLIKLRAIFMDHRCPKLNCNDFYYDPDMYREPIFSFLYFAGSISGNELVGKWTSPGPTANNGALLWPDAMHFFKGKIDQYLDR